MALLRQVGLGRPMTRAEFDENMNEFPNKFATIAALKAATWLQVGQVVAIEEYHAGVGGGMLFGRIVAGGTGTDDGGSYIDLPTSGLQFEQNFPSTISVKMFGAKGDGVTDDINAIQSAINFLSYGTVILPAGNYVVSNTIVMKSNVSVTCEDGVNILADNITTSSIPAVSFLGDVGPEYSLSVNANAGDNTITITSGEFNVGDLVHIVSVRNALSRVDAGVQWLGDGTASLGYAYYAEFAYIAESLGSNHYRLSRGLLFDGYNTTDVGETETERTSSTVKLVTPIKNSRWDGGEITRNSGGNDVFYAEFATECYINGCHITRGSVAGNSIQFVTSYLCEACDVTNTNDPSFDFVYGDHHGTRNRFKTVGTMDCGFVNIKESYGAQSIDFTYGSYAKYSNVRSYVKNSNFTRCFEELTSHPGCFEEMFINNKIVDCFDGGITVRGYMPIIKDNIIYSTVDDPDGLTLAIDQNYGIQLSYGATRRAIVSNNVIRNFYGAVRILGSSTLDWHIGPILVNISDNEISHCYTGLKTQFSNDTIKDAVRFITYKNNNHSFMGRFVADLDEYSAGTNIVGNTMNGGFRYSGSGDYVAFVYTNNTPMLTVANNAWLRSKGDNLGKTSYLAFVGSVSDVTTYPESSWSSQVFVTNNNVTFEQEDSVLTYISPSNYNLAAYADQETVRVINSGVIRANANKYRNFTIVASTEGGSASDDLDSLEPFDLTSWKKGDIVTVIPHYSSLDVTIRDVTDSGVIANGFQLAGGASISFSTINNNAQFIHNGTHWCEISRQTSA